MMLAPDETAAGPRSYVHAFALSAHPNAAQVHDWLANALGATLGARYHVAEKAVEVTWDDHPPTFTDPRFSRPLPSVGVGVASPIAFQERNWIEAMIHDVQAQFSKQFPLESMFFLARHLHSNPKPSTTLVDSMLVFPPIPGIGEWVREPISWEYLQPSWSDGDWPTAWNQQGGLDATFRVLLNRHLGGGWEHILSQHRKQALESRLPASDAATGRLPRF